MTNKSVTHPSAGATPTLHDYDTGAELRPATAEEHRASIRAARFDGGAGVIVLADGTRAYVTDGAPDTLPATGAHYSYLPIDVGFDPRTAGIAVDLPGDAGAVTLDDDGIQRRVEGSRSELVEALREAGYTVVGATP